MTPVAYALVGPAEIGRMLGVGRARVYQLTQEPGFAAPFARLAMGNVYEATAVVRSARALGRSLVDGVTVIRLPRRKIEPVGATEIGQMFEVGRARTYQLTQHPDFPEPVAHLAAGNVWDAAAVRRYAHSRGRVLAGEPDR